MPAPLDLNELPVPARRALDEGAPPKLRMAAARGILPGLRPEHIVTVVVGLAIGPPGEHTDTANQTLVALPEPVLNGALGSDLPELVIDALARCYLPRAEIIEPLLRMPRISMETVAYLAQYGSEQTTELIATNEERMLAFPRIIELLYLNKCCRMSTADRLVELAVRHGLELTGIKAFKEAAQAIEGELIMAEPSAEPMPEDYEFWETDELAEDIAGDEYDEEDLFFEDEEEGTEQHTDSLEPLFKRIGDMSISQKIRVAMLGTKEERALLIRDSNKLVATAAARSPTLQENEVVLVSRNRNVSEDVLRIFGTTAEWLKCYQVKRNLVENAKTPIQIAMRLVTQLREADLRKLAKNKNVSGAVRTHARRHLDRRKN